MIGRIIEIGNDKRYLHLWRGFLVINDSASRKEIAKIPLDDISAVIINAHGITYSNNILVELARRGIVFVLCGENHHPTGYLLPLEGHYELSRRLDYQIKASDALKKRLWAMLIKEKINNQANTLQALEIDDMPIRDLVRKVRAGDPRNIEAFAAKRYWSLLFGKDFKRDKTEETINALLNYGYTVLRSSVARAVVAAGLHPSIAIFHRNASNPMRLVDDLMEPFRPFVDFYVYRLKEQGLITVDTATKTVLAKLMYRDLMTEKGRTPLTVCLQNMAVSLAQIYLGERKELVFPLSFDFDSPPD